ncbi:MAG: methyltransferase domain-containing protein [Gemmataceae bacterium]|nr:methyltransferase domain-containing protein [Gemmataceae bacterium]
MRLRHVLVCVGALAPASVGVALGQAQPKPPRYEFRKDHDPDGIGKFYLGREIAQVMSHFGAGWLERPEREKEEHTSKLLPPLKIKPGAHVVDMGAGSGYYTFRLAGIVGKTGKVYAVDIQPEMLAIIGKRMKDKELKNIELVRGTETDPKLPAGKIDLILMVDVYHEFSHPYEMTEAMVKSLKLGGRLVFVEFRLEDDNVPIKLVHKMSEKQVLKEMKPHALRHVETQRHLPWQHVIIFEKKKE